ncbi:hypothetical protein [Metabacillus arenae]|uniref:Uncharacterized protein n=1 Tax=Metabacillus arenae TaxID=2771434 RepID=A0A926NHI7_9BACI|nr:hypothetical protein [Metabacillus arenae]MBD1383579.1 hypothetical protein [Metabacillus arenae]
MKIFIKNSFVLSIVSAGVLLIHTTNVAEANSNVVKTNEIKVENQTIEVETINDNGVEIQVIKTDVKEADKEKIAKAIEEKYTPDEKVSYDKKTSLYKVESEDIASTASCLFTDTTGPVYGYDRDGRTTNKVTTCRNHNDFIGTRTVGTNRGGAIESHFFGSGNADKIYLLASYSWSGIGITSISFPPSVGFGKVGSTVNWKSSSITGTWLGKTIHEEVSATAFGNISYMDITSKAEIYKGSYIYRPSKLIRHY